MSNDKEKEGYYPSRDEIREDAKMLSKLKPDWMNYGWGGWGGYGGWGGPGGKGGKGGPPGKEGEGGGGDKGGGDDKAAI